MVYDPFRRSRMNKFLRHLFIFFANQLFFPNSNPVLSRVISSIDKSNRIHSIDFKMTLLDPTRFLHLHFCDYLILGCLQRTTLLFEGKVEGVNNIFLFMYSTSVITWIDQTNPRQASTTDSFICSEPTTCEAGWIPWGTSCYGIIRGLSKNWKDARSDCLWRFGDLLIIDSIEEQNFLTNEIATDTAVSFNFFRFLYLAFFFVTISSFHFASMCKQYILVCADMCS